MKKMILLCGLLSTQVAMSEILRSPIHSIEPSSDSSAHLVKFQNGRVAFIKASDKNLLETLSVSKADDVVEVTLGERSELLSVSSIQQDKSLQLLPAPEPAQDVAEYVPTLVSGYPEAVAIFNRLNPFFNRVSECTNRAHVWAYDEFKKNGIKSEKVFIFFPQSYITRNDLKWWFHVAPLISVKENGQIVKRVLDVRYTDRPVTVEEWKNKFVFSKKACKIPQKISQYHVNDQTEDCFMMTSNMYYWMPTDFDVEESSGVIRSQFNNSALRAAYQEAF